MKKASLGSFLVVFCLTLYAMFTNNVIAKEPISDVKERATFDGFETGIGIGGWLTNYKRFNVLPEDRRL